MRKLPICLRVSLFCVLFPVSGVLYAEELRDPFTFGARTSTATQSRPMLIGILWDATHPLAMIGEQTVAVGDTVESWQVIAIEQDGIQLERGDAHEFVTTGHPLPK